MRKAKHILTHSNHRHLKISDFGLAFDGHWAHSQTYHTNQRHGLLDKLGIKVTSDDQDVLDDLEAEEEDYDAFLANKFSKFKPGSEDGAKREGLLNWRNRHESRKLARSVVGTSQYMAPEVSEHHGSSPRTTQAREAL